MSTLAQNRAVVVPGRRSEPTSQHWGMLLFESASAGVMAVFVGFMAVLVVVGVYVIMVWPLTFWDLANLHLERFESWVHPALWSVFGVGTLLGLLCFSGVIFGSKHRQRVPANATRSKPSGGSDSRRVLLRKS